MIIEPAFSPDQRRQINNLPPAEVLAKDSQSRPQLRATDRIFWVVLSRLWKNWRSALHVVRPETVVRWHRRGFRLYWAWKSRRRWGRPAIGRELRDLIQQMSRANTSNKKPRNRVFSGNASCNSRTDRWQDVGIVVCRNNRSDVGQPGIRLLNLLNIHYRAHPGVDTALELVHPGGKPLDLGGITWGHDSGRCQAGYRWD